MHPNLANRQAGRPTGFAHPLSVCFSQDPHETNDLAATEPELLESLKRRLQELIPTGLNQTQQVLYLYAPELTTCGANRTGPPCSTWDAAFVEMLKRNGGWLGPFLEE